MSIWQFQFINQFEANIPFLYAQKTSRKLWICHVCRGYKKGTFSCNGLIVIDKISQFIDLVFRSSHQRCSEEKVFLEISQNSQKNTYVRVSFLIKLQASGIFIKKEAFAQMFSGEFCEIFKNSFFKELLPWLLFEYVFLAVFPNLEIPYPVNKYTKSTTETLLWNLLKVNSRDWVSLLTTSNMSKNFFQVFFWCIKNMSLFSVKL